MNTKNLNERMLTATPLRNAVSSASQTVTTRPEFCRLPRPGEKCQLSGLNRTTLFALCKTGKIRSKVLRRVGATRGIRLLVVESLLAYLHGLPDDATNNKKGTEQ